MTWYMRTMTYKEKAREYTMAAKALGASNWRILFHHILPNTMVMIVTLAPFTIVANISALTALDYLGLGLMPPTPSRGVIAAGEIKFRCTLDCHFSCHRDCFCVNHGYVYW